MTIWLLVVAVPIALGLAAGWASQTWWLGSLVTMAFTVIVGKALGDVEKK